MACIWNIAFIFGLLWISINSQNVYKTPQGGKINLNPYTLQYLKQMLARSAYSRAQRPHVQNNLKIKALSRNPGLNPTHLNVKPIGVNPKLIQALYGSTFIKPSTGNADAGKYAYAHVPPPSAVKHNPAVKYNPRGVPNLGSMLYQYAKQQEVTQKQSGPANNHNQNLYKMFGQMTYGPMPKPSNFPSSVGYRQPQTQQRYQPSPQRTAYSPPTIAKPPPAPASYGQPSGYANSGSQYRSQPAPESHSAMSQSPYSSMSQESYQPAPASQGYQQQQSYTSQQQPSAYSPPKQPSYPSQPPSYTPPKTQSYQPQQQSSGYPSTNSRSSPSFSSPKKQQSDSGYGSGQKAWGGSIHISGTADGFDTPSFTGYKSPVAVMSSGYGQQHKQRSGYEQQGQSVGYGSVRKAKSFIGAGTTCSDVSAEFCHAKKAGHYSHPNNKHCFMQCDAFGRAYDKECAPGTSWRGRGPEPAYYNMCS